MRFLIISQYFTPEIGAPQVRLSAMTKELIKVGHEVEVVTAMPNHPTGKIFPDYTGKLYSKERLDGATVHRVWVYASVGAGLKRMLNYASFTLTSVLGLFKSKKPDFIFVESPPLFLSLPARLASIWWRVPIIFNVADLWPDSIRELGLMNDGPVLKFADALERWTYKRSSRINAVTEGIRKTLIEDKGVPEDKVIFLPNGADTTLFAPRAPDLDLAESLSLKGKRVIVYAGTIGFAQGLDTALDAMKIVYSREPDIRLVMIGDGSERERLQTRVREERINNVVFHPPSPPEFVARLYTLAFAGLAMLKNIPLFEGARPSKVFPIMSSAKAVIYSGAGEGARLVKEAEAGVVVAPENAEALADVIVGLSQNEALATNMGTNARKYVEKNLSWPKIIQRWLSELTS